MCNQACLDFGKSLLLDSEMRGKRVLEVGSFDVNGSLRSYVQAHAPASYHGTDIRMGPGVDEVCDAIGLISRFGKDSFDLVLSTEMLEHARDWRATIRNIKQVTRPGGTILIT